ncbi:phosphatidate cytidylyltransferase [Williamsoniiplasma luminosum]|uniref:Phosphatidate cytidylyltransferase n=1 Tax=Williamsoniiplasma luminosum TaxID=214888 RepID=A0A2S0NJ47_9MOLU|nr:phosphatidate cytidylyltransferase [Williamsoniiplasma luminosum]AVP49037.1 MAG: hypothetical protein C5T88_00330 [Williamsoniiplasma luminosum]
MQKTHNKEEVKTINTSQNRLKDLKTRVITSVFIVIFVCFYIMFSVLSTEAGKFGWEINPRITSYMFYGLGILLIIAIIYELAKSLGYKKVWMQIPIIIFALTLFYFPFFSIINKNIIYDDAKVDEWFGWWFTLAILFAYLFMICIFSLFTKAKHAKINALLLFAYSIVIILGFKAFSEIGLTMFDNSAKYGFITLIWIWAIVIFSDTFAYLGGSKFGKTKLAPSISPKKSLEGALIGTAFGTVTGILIAIFPFYFAPEFGPFYIDFQSVKNLSMAAGGILIALFSILISILGQIGDLMFSWLKRFADIKDFSSVIPAHGGILDRLDSFVFVFFFIFIIIQII